MFFEIRVRVRVPAEDKARIPEAIIKIKDFVIAQFPGLADERADSPVVVTIDIRDDEKKPI